MTSSLLSTTGNLTSSIGSKLTNTLGKLKTGDSNSSKGVAVDETAKASGKIVDRQSAAPKRGNGLGFLGL